MALTVTRLALGLVGSGEYRAARERERDVMIATGIVEVMWRHGVGQYRPKYMRGHFYAERYWFLQRFLMEKPGIKLRLPQ